MIKLFRKMARISIHMSSYGSLSNLIFFSMHNNRIIRENENGNENCTAYLVGSLVGKKNHTHSSELSDFLVFQGSSLAAKKDVTEEDKIIFE